MWRRIARATDGVVAVETALGASLILVPTLLGLWDLSQIAGGKIKVEGALQAAITYVAAGNTDIPGITAAARGAYGSSINVPTPSTVCYCVRTDSSGAPSAVSCGGSCGSGYDFEQFVRITTSLSVAIPVPLPVLGLGSTVTVSATGAVRTG